MGPVRLSAREMGVLWSVGRISEWDVSYAQTEQMLEVWVGRMDWMEGVDGSVVRLTDRQDLVDWMDGVDGSVVRLTDRQDLVDWMDEFFKGECTDIRWVRVQMWMECWLRQSQNSPCYFLTS
jgi:hypothetical protein